MKLIYTVPHVYDEASGPSYSVPRLARELALIGHEVRLASLGAVSSNAIDGGYRHDVYRQDFQGLPVLARLAFSEGLRAALTRDVREADLVHNHSLWLMPNVYPGWAASSAKRPLIVSPRGTLASAALSVSSFRKQIFWALAQARAVRGAAVLHATSEREYADIRAFGLRAPVAIIPNGIDAPPTPERSARSLRRLLFLGRLHPIKNFESAIEAWGALGAATLGWEFRLVGPSDPAYLAQLQAKARKFAASAVVFSGPSFGAAKDQEYADADAFILPSHSENFAVAAAEAMAHRLPVIASTGTPWSGLDARKCGWWVAPDAESLASAMRDMIALAPDALEAMGGRAQLWMAQDFSWPNIAEQMSQVYHWVKEGGAAPPTVRLD